MISSADDHGYEKEVSRILVIDDDPLVLEMVSETLQVEGYQVAKAENGKVGLQQFDTFSPHLIITDILMSSVDGLSVIREIKRIGPCFPVIAMSGGDRTFRSRDLLRIAQYEKADALLTKPFSRESLLAIVGQLLQHVPQE